VTQTRSFRRLFSLPTGGAPEGAPAVRERLLSAVLYAAAVLGTFMFIAIALSAVRQARWTLAIVCSLAYLWLLTSALLRRLPFNLRAGSLLLLIYAFGPIELLQGGLGGDGRIILLAFPALAAMLLGLWPGLSALALSLSSLAVVGWLMTSGQVPLPSSETAAGSGNPAYWIGAGLLFFALGTLITASVAFIVRGLETLLRDQHEALTRLQDEHSNLERSVADRTSDLERQAIQLQTAAEIAKLATQRLEPRELMSQAIELVRDRFSLYHASVFMLDTSGTWAELAASTGEAGRQLLARHHRLAVGSASIVGWVTANQKPRVAPDVEQDLFHYKNPLLPGTRSEVAVPVMIGQRLVGALDVQSTQPHAFSEPDVRAIEAIAAELAIAFENSRLMSEARSRLERSDGLPRGSWAESWSRLVRAGATTVVSLGIEGEAGGDWSAEEALGQEAAHQGRTLRSDDGRLVATPVQMRGEVFATISARKPAEPWTEDDIAVLEAVAGQAALALEGARQYTEEQRRLAELEVINRISQAASQLLNFDSLFRVLQAQVNQVLGETDLTIALYDQEKNQISIPYAGEGGEITRLDPTPLGEGLVSVVVRSRQPLLLVEDLEQVAAGLGATIIGRAPRSWLGVPMLVGDALVGVIVVKDMEHERRYSDDDAALLSTIASQVAAALENARLIDQVRRAARRQRLIHEITTKVRRSPDMDAILTTATRELSEGLSATRAFARLGGPPAAQTGKPEVETALGEPGGPSEEVRE
jgi:GAF domain-containing protein